MRESVWVFEIAIDFCMLRPHGAKSEPFGERTMYTSGRAIYRSTDLQINRLQRETCGKVVINVSQRIKGISPT